MARAPRASTEERRAQIVEATLDLLGERPLHDITTRAIAKHVGLSQPALFRHFRTRDALLLACVAQVRSELEAMAEALLRDAPTALDATRALVRGILTRAEHRPGLPRLLMSPDPVVGNDPVRTALRGLVSMQRSLVAGLVRQAASEGQLAPVVDARRAASALVALVQGAVLQWLLDGRPPGIAREADGLVALWLDGVRGGLGTGPAPVGRRRGPRLARVDARPLLAAGTDPLESILHAVDGVGPTGAVLVVAPFRPRPLLALLERMGHRVTDRESPPGVWCVEVVHGGDPSVIDLSELEPPEPLERVLEATEALTPGQALLARTPRQPRMLLPQLVERGLQPEVIEAPDGTALLRVERTG